LTLARIAAIARWDGHFSKYQRSGCFQDVNLRW